MAARHSAPTHWLRRLALTACALLLAGCGQLLQLRSDILEGKNSIAWFRGTVESPNCADCPMIIVALADVSGKRVQSYRVYENPGNFVLAAPVDSRYILAFNDLNGDFEYQPDEPAAWHELKAHEGIAHRRDNIQLFMRQPGESIPGTLQIGNLFALRGAALGLIGVQLGSDTTLDSPLFDPDIAGLGMWQPIRFMKAGYAGIYFLEPYTAQKTPVLFLHGIGGSPRDFASMINTLDRKKFQPWVLYYPSGLELPAMGGGVLGLLSALHLRYRFDNLHLVAHSMGGLVARGYLAACEEAENCEYVRSFTSISSPFGGDSAAQSGVDYSPVVMPVWKSLAPGSRFLQRLFAKPMPNGAPHYMLFGYRNSSRVRSGSSDGTVRLSSLLRPEAQKQAAAMFGYDEDHESILESTEVHAHIGRILLHHTPGYSGP